MTLASRYAPAAQVKTDGGSFEVGPTQPLLQARVTGVGYEALVLVGRGRYGTGIAAACRLDGSIEP